MGYGIIDLHLIHPNTKNLERLGPLDGSVLHDFSLRSILSVHSEHSLVKGFPETIKEPMEGFRKDRLVAEVRHHSGIEGENTGVVCPFSLQIELVLPKCVAI